MNHIISCLVFGWLPFFLIIFESILLRVSFEKHDGTRFPRAIVFAGILVGFIPIINFITSVVAAIAMIGMILDTDSKYRLRKEKGFLNWFFSTK